MAQFLNFSEISQQIPFKQVLNWLCVPYAEKKSELRGKLGDLSFIANIDKNTFFCPKGDLKGGIINFTSHCLKLSLRDAALALSTQFLNKPKEPKREIPNLELHYCKPLENHGISKETAEKYEVGLVKQKSIVSGRICFKIYDQTDSHIGYIGYHEEKKDWFFPKNFKRPLYNLNHFPKANDIILTVNPFHALNLCQRGYNACSLLGKSMTESQFDALKNPPIEKIILIHPEPDNIILRLAPLYFVKTCELETLLERNSVE